MRRQSGRLWQRLRIVSQIAFTALFFFLLLRTGAAATETFAFSDVFFYFDPLLLLLNLIATHQILPLFLLSLIPLGLTLVFGRFFCGWICPMGAIQQFFTRVFRRGNREKTVDKRMLKWKYVILAGVLISALMGAHLGGWLDPFSLLTRSTAIVVSPAVNHTLDQTLKAGSQEKGWVSKALKPVYGFAREQIMTNRQRVFAQSLLVGALFFGLIFLNLYRRRFFCNALCPLGALYGLVARFSLFNLKVDEESCRGCNVCAKNCTYNGSPYQDYMKSECLVCFNCTVDCPHDAIRVRFLAPRSENRTPIDLGRRKVIGSIAVGGVIASLARIAPAAGQRMHPFTRPPGSVSEREFLEKCVRCGECMQVCPTNFIQPALLETGWEGIWTPVLAPANGYCEYECRKCTQVCPTRAIERLTLEEKKAFKIGTAVVDRNRCYTYADGYNCAVCEEHCPVPDKAIRFREVELWNFEGRRVTVNQIYVVPDLCIGCGICQNVCPRSDAPGILLTAEEEEREFSY